MLSSASRLSLGEQAGALRVTTRHRFPGAQLDCQTVCQDPRCGGGGSGAGRMWSAGSGRILETTAKSLGPGAPVASKTATAIRASTDVLAGTGGREIAPGVADVMVEVAGSWATI